MKEKEEGWTWLTNSRKWHYFREGKSLCKKFQLFRDPQTGYEKGNLYSIDNCKGCRERVVKEITK